MRKSGEIVARDGAGTRSKEGRGCRAVRRWRLLGVNQRTAFGMKDAFTVSDRFDAPFPRIEHSQAEVGGEAKNRRTYQWRRGYE
jgi:hypothetical protein